MIGFIRGFNFVLKFMFYEVIFFEKYSVFIDDAGTIYINTFE